MREGRRDQEVAELDAFFRAHRLPARAALLCHQVAHRLGARARLRRLPGGHRQALRAGGQRRAEAGSRAGVRGLEADPSGPGSGQLAVLHGGRGLWLGAEPGEGLQLRRPDRGFLLQRLRRPHQLRLQERYRDPWTVSSPGTQRRSTKGRCAGSVSSTTSALTTTGRRTTGTGGIHSAPGPASSSRPAAPRSTTGTSWPGRSRSRAPRGMPISARS